ncbi:MAG: hypoxanthine phosphoribosyltransferase [Verrucomicrobiales bacterium]|nr:hypoxanthine phosphoribosyltransferase [Verrucomicrobiales bacterium]
MELMSGENAELSSRLDKILFDQAKIRECIASMGAGITQDYHGEPLTIIVVLQGGALFMADLIREIHLPLRIDSISVASYHGGTKSSGVVTFLQDKLPDIEGRHVLLVDDILDTGRTISAIAEKLREEGKPKSLKIAVLLKKSIDRAVVVDADYWGFEVGNEFVVGYGLDYQGEYRNLPVIGVLKEEFIAKNG